jgi:hypothetical protein
VTSVVPYYRLPRLQKAIGVVKANKHRPEIIVNIRSFFQADKQPLSPLDQTFNVLVNRRQSADKITLDLSVGIRTL